MSSVFVLDNGGAQQQKSNESSRPSQPRSSLACIRCRTKKGKCSKTRPSCARCERSNHPCEYPDAPPNLTDLSKKVLDLYDSLRDLEGELLFKYMQPPTDDRDSIDDKDLLDNSDPMPLTEINSTTPPIQHQQSSSTKPTGTTTDSPPPSVSEKQDIDWSMSYLSDGISIQTSTHTISEFTRFIDKLTQQLFRDFGTDGSFSTYWNLDASHGDLMDDNNDIDDDDDDDLDEDDYLVTVPIFDTTSFLPARSPVPCPPAPTTNQKFISSALPTLLPSLLQYVHRQLKYIDDTITTTNTNTTVHHHVTPLLHQLSFFLPAQDDDQVEQNPLTTLYIMTAYLTCTTFFRTPSKDTSATTDIMDPMIGQNWTPREGYLYAKTMLVDIILQVTPTHGMCLSALLLLSIQLSSPSTFDGGSPHVLLDLAWRMAGSGLLWHQGTAMTPETETIAAALVYLDTYTRIFASQQQPSTLPSHLGNDIGSALRQRISISKTQQRQRICILLESQLMWLLSQVLGLFYTTQNSNNDNSDNTETVKVRKVDVDEVLTLVRDLEQWEQQLPSWAKCDSTTDTSLPQATTYSDDNNSSSSGMIDQLHLTLHIIKILLFRPFCTAFNQHGMEQTYTKTTFLDLSMHSASRLATCVAKVKHDGDRATDGCDDDDDDDDDIWFLMAYRLIRDVVDRVRTTFDDDQDIKLQLDDIIHRIEK